jgi:hypothetical protein
VEIASMTTNLNASPVPGPRHYHCPICGRDDQVQLLSVVVQSGTTMSSGGGTLTMGGRLPRGGGSLNLAGGSTMAGEARTGLAERLAWSHAPDINETPYRWAYLIAGVSAVFGWLVASNVSPAGIWYVLAGAAIGAVTFWLHLNRRAALRARDARWRREMAIWATLMYCARDDYVWAPDEEAVPADGMAGYVRELAGTHM